MNFLEKLSRGQLWFIAGVVNGTLWISAVYIILKMLK